MKRGAVKKVGREPVRVDLALVHAQVHDLLRDSMAQHMNARALKRGGNLEGANTAMRQAAELRVKAHGLDPEHVAAAWTLEQIKTPEGRDTHHEMMIFYRSKGLL